MGLFKKKKAVSLPELPPLPSPPGMGIPAGDIPQIRAPEEVPEITEPSPITDENAEIPEAPLPEIPEAPAPEEPLPAEQPVQVLEPVGESIESERVRRPVGPAFVSVDDYRTILEHSGRVRAKLLESENFLRKLQEIKDEEEKTFDRWRAQLEDVERKLGQIDRLIARAKR